MESFLVYLFNFYYAIIELEQNKQNNTIIFFFTIYFFNKKVDRSSLRGGAGAPIAPPLPTGLLMLCSAKFTVFLSLWDNSLSAAGWKKAWRPKCSFQE